MFQDPSYVPSLSQRIYRVLAKILTTIFFINGRSSWGNEFLQSIDPSLSITNPITSKQLHFKTGHGRLFWRVTTTPSLELETNHWISRLKPSDIFLDVGSNIGLYSLMAAQAIECKVYSFEMEPLNYSIQHYNILANNLNNYIYAFPFALSSTTSLSEVYYKSISPGDALHSINRPSPMLLLKENSRFIQDTIATVSLDDFFSLYSLPLPTHLKLDVDGCEYEILTGALHVVLPSIREVLVEVDQHSYSSISTILFESGFSLICEYPPHSTNINNFNVLYVRS